MDEIFSFDKNLIHNHLIYDLKILSKIKKSFKYLGEKLPNQKPIDLNKIKWFETKNYNWCVIKKDDVRLIIRHYDNHFTIYTETIKRYKTDTYTEKKYGAFTFYTDTKKVENPDAYCDDRFIDLNIYLNELIETVKEDKLHSLWNDYSFKRPEYIEIKTIFYGETIISIDQIIFACEEIFQVHLELFAQNDMLEKLKELEVGQNLGSRYKIDSISTEVKDEYYHGVGVTLTDTMDNNKKKFEDVYALTRWFYNDVFKKVNV